VRTTLEYVVTASLPKEGAIDEHTGIGRESRSLRGRAEMSATTDEGLTVRI